MERKLKTIFIINLIFIFTIVSIPSFVIFAEFSNFSRIDKSLTFIYSSTIPPINKELILNTEVGLINIKYITQPVDYLIRIDVDIELAGPNLNGKSYLDLFIISWENLTSPINFTLDLTSNMLVDFTNLHKANVNINVMLRADIIFDIKANVIDGTIEFANLMGITVNNLFFNVDTGNIYYDFTHCTVEGNITGIVNYGNITLKSYNNWYTQNCKFSLNNVWEYILIDIYQYEEMSVNITVTAITKTGIIRLNYKDESANIGAQCLFYNKTDFGSETETIWRGFDREILPLNAGQSFVSYDFPTRNNFYFSLNKYYDSGDYMWDLYSVPTT
jgi:hypothetical protein